MGSSPWAGSSPLILWTRLAGELIFAFTPPAATTGSWLATITPPLRTSETLRFLERDSNIGAGALVVSRSTDNGITWSGEITVATPVPSFATCRSPATPLPARMPVTSTSPGWTKAVVAFHTTTPTSSSSQPTAAPPGLTPTQALPSQAPASSLAVSTPTSPARLPITVATSGTRAGASRRL